MMARMSRARLITRQAALAYEELRQAGGTDAGTLQIALNPLVTLTALGEAFRWFRQRYQNVGIEFSDGLIQGVLPRLRDGTLDLALVAADADELQGDEFRIASRSTTAGSNPLTWSSQCLRAPTRRSRQQQRSSRIASQGPAARRRVARRSVATDELPALLAHPALGTDKPGTVAGAVVSIALAVPAPTGIAATERCRGGSRRCGLPSL